MSTPLTFKPANKEYEMTITNHLQRIDELTIMVIGHVDARDYPSAHSALDDIELRARLAHEHVDHLQLIAERTFTPAEET